MAARAATIALLAAALALAASVPSVAQTTRPGARPPPMLKPPVPRQPTTRSTIAPRATVPATRGDTLTKGEEQQLRARLRTLDAEYQRRLDKDGKDSADAWRRAREQQYRQEAPGRP